MKRSIFVCDLRVHRYIEFCGFIELTFHKVGEWKWIRDADISICRCAIAMEKRRAEGSSISGCVVPRRATVIKNLFVAGKCIDFCRRPTTSERYCIFGECARFIILTSAGRSRAENQYLVYVLRMNSRDRLSICKYFMLEAVPHNFWIFTRLDD